MQVALPVEAATVGQLPEPSCVLPVTSGQSTIRVEARRAQLAQGYQPQTSREGIIEAEFLRVLNELYKAREARLTAAAGHIPVVIWWIIAIGGAVSGISRSSSSNVFSAVRVMRMRRCSSALPTGTINRPHGRSAS